MKRRLHHATHCRGVSEPAPTSEPSAAELLPPAPDFELLSLRSPQCGEGQGTMTVIRISGYLAWTHESKPLTPKQEKQPPPPLPIPPPPSTPAPLPTLHPLPKAC